MKSGTSSITAALVALLLTLGLTGCNTLEGIGEDFQAAGAAVGIGDEEEEYPQEYDDESYDDEEDAY